MAKVKHNNLIDTLNEMAENAKARGIIQLYAEDEQFNGREITIQGVQMRHFGATGYLGLDQDTRLKEAAIDAIRRYGTQFPLSRSYVSQGMYAELETKLQQMYGHHVLVMKNSTLGHLGVIPTIVRDEDGMIFDHQVHWSVQNAGQLLKPHGIPIEMVRHNDLSMLEDKIREMRSRCARIWYFADGIYSMYGDVAPIDGLKQLMAQYPQLCLYFDDVHGQSWVGKNGTGYVMSQFNTLPENVIIFGTLSKSFGASGGMMITSNPEFYQKVKNFGGPLTFSAQLEPASIAAASAAADIHMSPEIYELQNELADKIRYCNDLIRESNLPLVEENFCPVFYIGTGAPEVGYSFVKRMLADGFFVNMGMFPAVPVKRTGARVTISRLNTHDDIRELVRALQRNFEAVLEEKSVNAQFIRRIFGLNNSMVPSANPVPEHDLVLELHRTAHRLDAAEWNRYMAGHSVFDHDGLCFLERAFTQLEQPDLNWQFFYITIRDSHGTLLLKTFLTYSLWKDDMLAPESVSMELEEKRKTDPYYLSSKVLSVGSTFTEGQQLYLNRQHPRWQEAIDLFIHELELLEEELHPSMIVLRDFEDNDDELKDYILKKGFIKTDLPESCVLQDMSWPDERAFVERLSARSRKHFRQEIAPFTSHFQVEIQQQPGEEELEVYYQLYLNVWRKNYALNTFPFTRKVLSEMAAHPNWELLVLRLTDVYDDSTNHQPVGVMFCYKNGKTTYVPAFVGLNYEVLEEHQVYRQLLFQTILRARSLGFQQVDFGLTASFEKRKLGATIIPKIAFVQARDNFSMEMMGLIQSGRAS